MRHTYQRGMEEVGKACEWAASASANATIRLLLQDERATPATLALLRGIKVGRVEALVPLGEEQEGLEEVVLCPEEAKGQDEIGDGGGTGLP